MPGSQILYLSSLESKGNTSSGSWSTPLLPRSGSQAWKGHLSDAEMTCWYSDWPVTLMSERLSAVTSDTSTSSTEVQLFLAYYRDVTLSSSCVISSKCPKKPMQNPAAVEKKIEGNDWKAFPCLFLCPGARQRYEKGCCSECWLYWEQWLEPASPVALDYFNYPARCGLF